MTQSVLTDARICMTGLRPRLHGVHRPKNDVRGSYVRHRWLGLFIAQCHGVLSKCISRETRACLLGTVRGWIYRWSLRRRTLFSYPVLSHCVPCYAVKCMF